MLEIGKTEYFLDKSWHTGIDGGYMATHLGIIGILHIDSMRRND